MYGILQIFGIVASILVGSVAFGVGPAIVWMRLQQLDFLLEDSILIPLIVLTLILVQIGLFGNFKRHGYARPMVFGVASGLAIISGLWLSKLLAAGGYALIVWAFFEDYHVLNQYLTNLSLDDSDRKST